MAFNILAAFSDSIIYDFHKKFKFYARCRQKEFAEYFYFAIALLQGEKENTEKLASRERGCQFRLELYRFDIMVKMPVFHSLVLSDVVFKYFF